LSVLFLERLHEVVNELHFELPSLLIVIVLYLGRNLISIIVSKVLQLPNIFNDYQECDKLTLVASEQGQW
jgi:hypothetical protein